MDELALGENGVVETGFDEESVDLLEGVDVVAFGEEVHERVVFDEFVGRVGAGKKVENGR